MSIPKAHRRTSVCGIECTVLTNEEYESLQSQLAAANERADGLQKIVEAARAQKPVAWLADNGLWSKEQPGGMESFVLSTMPVYAAPVPAQPAVVPEGLAKPKWWQYEGPDEKQRRGDGA